MILSPDRQTPERDIQVHVVSMLRAYLPAEVWWSASLSGVTLTTAVAKEAKRVGMEKGAPDLSFIWPTGETSYIEMKSANGTLTPEQRRLQAVLTPLGLFAVCRSWLEVREALTPRLSAHGLRWLTDGEAIRLRRAA